MKRARAGLVLAVAVASTIGCGRGTGDPAGEAEVGAFVLDRAGRVGPESKARLEDILRALLEDADVELVAVSVPALDGTSIDAYSRAAFEEHGVGGRTRGGRGLLLVVAVAERRVRLEVGYALEGVLTDAFVGYVEREQMAPYFAEGRVGEGFEATVELVAGRVFERIRQRAYDPSRREPGTVGGFGGGGAGARAAVEFGDSSVPGERPRVPASERGWFAAQPTPALAWERFLEANRRHLQDPDLGIYDASARAILRERPVTPAGQDDIARVYEGVEPTIRIRGERAVVLFPDDPDHVLAPWFFVRSPEGWRLAGGAVRDLVAYNHRNQWHFRRTDHAWMFAFEDFRFDRHGFAFHRARE